MKNILAFLGLLLAIGMVAAAPSQFNVTNAGYYSTAGYKINNVLQTPDRIYPGDEVQLRFNVQNMHTDTANSVHLIALTPISGDKQDYSLGSIASQQTKDVIVDFRVPDNGKPGTYDVFLYIIDELGAQSQVGDIPLTVEAIQQTNTLIAAVVPSGDSYAGDSKQVEVGITNNGKLPATDVVIQMQSSSASSIMPLGTDRQYIASIKPGETVKANFNVGIASGVTPGFYSMTYIINYNIDKNAQPAITQAAGMKVLAKTSLLVSTEGAALTTDTTGATTIPVTIANIGDIAVRGVYAKAESSDFTITSGNDKFIGTLNLDDSATMSVTITPKRRPGVNVTAGNVAITVTYKDPLNIEHTDTTLIPVDLSSGFRGGGGAGTTGTNQRFGRQQNNGFTILGQDPFVVLIGVIVLILIYVAYKWRKRHSK